MIENEVASIIKAVLDCSDIANVYYNNIPESFAVPAVFFPSPEIEIQPDTLSGYASEYTMYVNFFHSTTEDAYELAVPVLHGITSLRKLVPLLNTYGEETGDFVRIKNMNLKKADECAYQLQIDWISRRPYTRSEAELVREFYINGGRI